MLRHAAFAIVVLATLLPAFPASAEYAPDASRIDWFVVVSDSHIGSSGDRANENLAWLTREGAQSIQPTLILNCGDLTDATGLLPIPTGQQEEEWTKYRAILDDGGVTPDTYVDLPGNHDQYADKGMPHYLQYSIQGSADHQTQHSIRRDGPAGSVHLLTTSTPASDGGGVLADNATLDAGELAFLQKAFDDNADATVRLAFGHHPVDRDIGNSIEGGKAEFKALLEAFDVDAYVYGHTHAFASEYRGRTLHLNLDSLGKSDQDHVALLAVDAGALSARVFAAATWPYVVTTAPVDVNLGGGNPRATNVPANWTQCPVRALVFGDKAPDAVRFQVDGGAWTPMAEAQPHVWAATFDSTGMAAGTHTLRVQASPWNRNDHETAFRVGATACSNGIDDDVDGRTDWPDDPGCASPAGEDEAAHPVVPPDDPDTSDVATIPDAAPDVPAEDVPAIQTDTQAEMASLPDQAPGADDGDVPPAREDATLETSPDAPTGLCVVGATRCDGAALVQCAADARTWTTVESCADRGMTCTDGACVAGAKGGGCSAGARSPVPAGFLLPFLVALAALAARPAGRRTGRP
jgi:predicted phosphodiesterase